MRKIRIFRANKCVDCVQKQGKDRIFRTCITHYNIHTMRIFQKKTCAMRIIRYRILWKTPDCCKIKKEAASAFQGLPLLSIYSIQAVPFMKSNVFERYSSGYGRLCPLCQFFLPNRFLNQPVMENAVLPYGLLSSGARTSSAI